MSPPRLLARPTFRLLALLLLASPAIGQTPRDIPPRKGPIQGLWLMGQSLCDGSESLPLVTLGDTGRGNLAFKRGVRTWLQLDHGADPAARADADFTFVPLTAAANGALGETIANGLADHLTAAAAKTQSFSSSSSYSSSPAGTAPPSPTSPTSPTYLVAYAGQGGRTIGELSAADLSTDPRSPKAKQQGGGYYKTSLDDARRATAQARALGRPFHIAALVWMQGEGNGGPTGGLVPTRWDAELPRPAGQEWYRDQLIAYRRQWSADLRAITGQPGTEIPLFTYQTLGPAGEAQLMAADQDPHITMVGPHYMVPSAINSRYGPGRHGDAIHLSADGERWYGEQIAKVMHRVLHEHEDWQPLRPLKAAIDPPRTSILIDFHVPRPPLVLDDTFLPRQQVELGKDTFSSLAGFQVRNTTTRAVIPLTTVEVASPTRLRIRLASPLPPGTNYHLSCGQAQAGSLGQITAVRASPTTSHPMTEVALEGPPSPVLALLLNEGAFTIANNLPGAAYAQTIVRSVHIEGNTTTLRFADRDLRNATPFAVGQDLRALRPFSYSNLRDSDPEPALHTFTDPAYGQRQAQTYPLWNWCILFDQFPIADPSP